MSLTIAVDYDNTITCDKTAFAEIISVLIAKGHCVVIITGRKVSEPVDSMFTNLVNDVVYCDDEFKSVAASRRGYSIDIWIDDEPGHIEPQRKLNW